MTNILETIGRYQVLGPIGHVHLSALYSAWDPQLDTLVAIKLLVADDERRRDRFRRSARALAQLRHPHVVSIEEIGEEARRPYLAMKYIEGVTLADRMHEGPSFSTRRTLQVIRDLCAGLSAAHRSAIVHGDVQPATIMFDGDDVLQIVGWDVARAALTTEQAPLMIGAHKFMSPEQIEGRPPTMQSDVFAVGAVFHELLWQGQAPARDIERRSTERAGRTDLDPLTLLARSTVDPKIVRIISRCLETMPGRRFPDLAAVQDEIDRVQTGLPDAGEPQTARTRWIPRVVRRRPPAPGPNVIPPPDRQPEAAQRDMPHTPMNLETAEQALAAGAFDEAIAACEEVLLADPANETAFDLLDRARTALDEQQVGAWLNQAHAELQRGAPAAASDLVQRAAVVAPASPRVAELRRMADEALELRGRERERAETVCGLVERGEDLLAQGAWADALAAADQALDLDAASPDARMLRLRAADAIDTHQRAELERRVSEAVRESKRLFDEGDHDRALDVLSRFEPAHDRIAHARDQLAAAVARLNEQRLEAERMARAERIGVGVAAAREDLATGRFEDALARLRAVQEAEGDSPEIDLAHAAVRDAQAEAERRARLQRELAEHVARAAGLLARNDPHAALGRVNAALAIDPHHRSATALRSRIEDALRRDAQRSEAEERVARARAQRIAHALEAAQLAASHAAAIALLTDVLEWEPSHQLAQQLLRERREAYAREQADKQRRLDAARVQREQIDRLVEAGRQALRGGDLAAARSLAQRALEHDAHADAARLLLEDLALFGEDGPLEQEAQAEPEEPKKLDDEIVFPAESAPAYDEPIPVDDDPAPADVATMRLSVASSIPPGHTPPVPPPTLGLHLPPTAALHKPWLVIVIAAAGFAALAGTTYYTIATASAGEPPSTTSAQVSRLDGAASVLQADDRESATARQAAESQTRAERAFARGDWQEGLAAAEEASRLRPGDVAIEEILDAALTDARARIIEARDAAQRAGAAGSPNFRDAEQKRREGDRLARAGKRDEAIRALWDGIQMLDRVRTQTERTAVRR